MLCIEEYPPGQHGDRKRRRDCIGSWQARYRDPTGRQTAKNFTKKDGGKTAAEAFLDKVHTSVRERTYRDPARGKITLETWHETWWEIQEKKGRTTTVNRKRCVWTKHVQPRWGGYRLVDLEFMELQKWLSGIRSHETQGRARAMLRSMLDAAIRDGERISINPATHLEVTAARPQRHPDDLKPPTTEQYALIHAALPEYYQVLLRDFAYETGLRPGEYAGLRNHCIDDEERLVHIKEILISDGGRLRRQAAPKTDAGFRTVPLTDRAWGAVQFMRDKWRPKRTRSAIGDGFDMHLDELVFRGPRGAALNVNNLSRPWHKATLQAGVARKVYNPDTKRHEWWPRVYDYRHDATSRMHHGGVSEVDAQRALGQERGGRVTWIYTHESEGAREQVRAALGGGSGLRAVK
ncbi:tyrosine-type recombinase/integrase [Streptomyces sp. NPDC006711]|uniref:tyrosine-type recombinase/integrase n=1 Tax=Streptomyces sp. NPDC006711 TaxID=3364762 RepID=UPI0036BCFCEA